MTHTHNKERGYVLLLALLLMSLMTILLSGFVQYAIVNARSERANIASMQAVSLAEAGVDEAIYQLNRGSGYTGESNTALGNGTFTTSVSTVDASTKRITSTGYVPNNTTPISQHTVVASVLINSSIVSFSFGAQVGNGGLTMSNNSKVIGNIFSNGNISGSGTITGSATVAAGTQTTPDQQWNIQDSSINLGDVPARQDVAMSFQPSVSNTLNDARLNLKKFGTPGDITIEIVPDYRGVPSTTVLATGDIRASAITTSYAYAAISFATLAPLVAGQTYWIIAVASVDPNNYFIWGGDSKNGYVQGIGMHTNAWNAPSPSWSVNNDLDFQTYMGGLVNSLSGVTVQGNVLAHSLSNCTIGGNATYQTISSCLVSGSSTVSATDPSPATMPISDSQINAWEAIASSGSVIAGPYNVSGTQTLGPTEIDGDLTFSNRATLILAGPIWVKGNVNIANNGTLTVAASTGNSGAILIADKPGNLSTSGTINVSNNATITGNGNANSFPMIISTNSGVNAITMANNAGSAIVYASNGTIVFSNNAGANEVTGYGISLQNGATITYVNGLQSAAFSNGPGGSWVFVPGSYAITK